MNKAIAMSCGLYLERCPILPLRKLVSTVLRTGVPHSSASILLNRGRSIRLRFWAHGERSSYLCISFESGISTIANCVHQRSWKLGLVLARMATYPRPDVLQACRYSRSHEAVTGWSLFTTSMLR
ncbi:hypothetical protein AcV5_008280 [Taiwanofungus camphoratus]|nr:hypothetical protein AcV5_008280 [Antrodia cinnamomea]